MALNKIAEGKILDYLNESGSTILSGDPVLVGATLGVALCDIADDAIGSVAICEVFEIRKATGAVSQGALLYWDADGNPVVGASGIGCLTTTDTANVYAGRAYAAAESADATVQIKLG